jgi:hypothetical protein
MFRQGRPHDYIPNGTECIIVRHIENNVSSFLSEEDILRGLCFTNIDNKSFMMQNCVKYNISSDAINKQNGQNFGNCEIRKENVAEIYVKKNEEVQMEQNIKINNFLNQLKKNLIKYNRSLIGLLSDFHFETEVFEGANQAKKIIIFTLKRGNETEGIVELEKMECIRKSRVPFYAINRIYSKHNNPKTTAVLLASVLPFLRYINTDFALILNWTYDDKTYEVLQTFGFESRYLNKDKRLVNFCDNFSDKYGLFLNESYLNKPTKEIKEKYFKTNAQIYDAAERILLQANTNADDVEDLDVVSILSSLRNAKNSSLGGKKQKRKKTKRQNKKKTRKTTKRNYK